MLTMLHHWDLLLFHAVNGWCGNWALDRIVFYEQGNQLLEGGVILTCYWWFWFATPSDRREANRRTILAALVGVFLSLVISRVLASILPFRMRPMYVAGIGYHAPSLEAPMNLENWSSFPSDTAAYFIGLTYGLYRVSRRVGIVALSYAAVWICLPRLYLGIHYPSDLVVGALIGVAVVALSLRFLGGHTRAADRMLHFVTFQEERRPGWFYAAAFVLSFEMAMTFDDVRDFIRALLHGLRMAGYASLGEEDVLLALLAVLAIGGVSGWALWRATRRSGGGNASPDLMPAGAGEPCQPVRPPSSRHTPRSRHTSTSRQTPLSGHNS
jgi:undecaprenyl-diphosphatase